MIKRFMFAMTLLLSFIGVKAQMNGELPLNPNVIHGTLPNGLNYYILHNEEPKNRANFYIAQKVGSTLETPEQLGLAHFLEHMAFNGTTHYPGKDMLNYLEHKGIRFGSDINAYTSFDETVYNINNVPTTDVALMDSVLLVLSDWSGSILLEEDEINAERGVIQNEYTMRNDASTRMLTAILPKLYDEYQYRQMPIGSMEIVKNFPPQAIRDYYKKWYRPDLQGIVIVGDFDAKEMEEKVKALFSQISMPENPAARVYETIGDYDKPRYVTFEDPELQIPRIDTYFKFERTPREARNSIMAYLVDNIAAPMVATMINNRLNEYSQKADCPYSYAGVSVGSFLVSDQKGSFSVVVIPKEDYLTAYESAMSIITRACKTGFMGTEVQRVRDQLLANMETRYNERDKTNSEVLAREIIRYFVDNEPAPGVDIEYKLLSQILPTLPEEAFNEIASNLLNINNVAIVVTQPSTLGLNIPEENVMLESLNNVINADYEPYVDEEITEPLISNMPTPGKIVSEKDGKFNTKEYILSNGVKVIVKPTDFSNDEILIQMSKRGGKASYPSSESVNVRGMELVLEVSNIGPFNPTRLGKYLAGKKVALTFDLGNFTDDFNGYSTVKDVASLFELLYASFTDVTPDQETYEANLSQMKTFLANQESNPEYIFGLRGRKILYPETPVLYSLSLEDLNKFDYAKMMSLYKESIKNAADYTLIITGNVDESVIKPILEQYVATLPSTGKASAPSPSVVPMIPVPGKVKDEFTIPAQSPAVFYNNVIHQEGMPFNIENSVKVELIGNVLYMIYLETLREEMGGTYSPYAVADLNPYTSTWSIMWYVGTTEEMMEAIVNRANEEFNRLMQNGTDQQHFAKVREAALKQLENNERTNQFWKKALALDQFGFDTFSGKKEALENLTLEEFNKFIKTLYNGQNQVEIIGIAK